MLLSLIGFCLIGVSLVLMMVAIVISIIQGFKESTGWGIANLAGFFCLGLIPNLIFILMDIKNRSEPLTIFLGCLFPYLLGIYLTVTGTFVASIQ